MYYVIASLPEKLARVLEPYRQRFDPLSQVMPAHITIVRPFEFSDQLEKLYYHLSQVSERHAPIRAFLVGWDVHEEKGYQIRLPMTAGRTEFIALHTDLLTDILGPLADQQKSYQPYVVFGRFVEQTQLDLAKKSLKEFEPRFSFRVTHMELWQRDELKQPWSLDRKFSLKATIAGARGKKQQAV